MTRFNKKSKPAVTSNAAGGIAYKVDSKVEFASFLLTSFLSNKMYESSNDSEARLLELFQKVPSDFAAKAALYARNKYGMRSVTHVVGAEIAKYVKAQPWTKKFFVKLFRRIDDMSEIVSRYISKYGRRPIPNALKKALRIRLSDASEYELSKYRGEGRAVKLVDLVNLVHPKGTTALKKLVEGKLKSTQTWETKLTQAGQKAQTEEEKEELKKEAWDTLLSEGKLGYLAALRNVRNICAQASEDTVNKLLKILTNKDAIHKSLVFPYQILMALTVFPPDGERRVKDALCEALDISVDNVPEFPGKTCVMLDISYSMHDAISDKSQANVISVAATFAFSLFKRNKDCDVVLYNTGAAYFGGNSQDSVATMAATAASKVCGGTDLSSAFQLILTKKKYDRIIVLSDMQSWAHENSMVTYFNAYKMWCKQPVKLYSFDVRGYGTSLFPEQDVFLLSGVSEKTFDVMKIMEEDRQALVHEIEAVEL